MTPLRLTREEVEALGDHGPWRMSAENGGGIVAGQRRLIVSACSSPLGWPRVQIEEASKELLLAAPDLRADLLTLHAEVERLRAERERLLAWLSRIEGGDNPTAHADTRRHWAWSAGMGVEP